MKKFLSLFLLTISLASNFSINQLMGAEEIEFGNEIYNLNCISSVLEQLDKVIYDTRVWAEIIRADSFSMENPQACLDWLHETIDKLEKVREQIQQHYDELESLNPQKNNCWFSVS